MKLTEWNNVSVCVRLLLAFLCGMLLGLHPEYKRRPAGMRTHTLVCLGAATAAMTGFYVFYNLNMNVDPLRVGAQVISGIGFLGVGTILTIGRNQVKGLTTAAGLWTSAAVGLSLGTGFYLGALLCTVLALFTITILEYVEKQKIKKVRYIDIYLEITDIHQVNQIIALLQEPKYCIENIQVKAARSELEKNLGVEATMEVGMGKDKRELLDQIAAIEDIAFAIESE